MMNLDLNKVNFLESFSLPASNLTMDHVLILFVLNDFDLNVNQEVDDSFSLLSKYCLIIK